MDEFVSIVLMVVSAGLALAAGFGIFFGLEAIGIDDLVIALVLPITIIALFAWFGMALASFFVGVGRAIRR